MKFVKSIMLDISSLPVEQEEKYAKLYPIFKTRIEERSGASVSDTDGEITVRFTSDEAMAEEAFDISDIDGGIEIKGKNFNSLMFGAGQLLHKSRYDEKGVALTDWRGYSAPDCSFRVIYFAVHFFNWYQNTSSENLNRYFEDLMLWGYNGVCAIASSINAEGPEDPVFINSAELVKKLFSSAKAINSGEESTDAY